MKLQKLLLTALTSCVLVGASGAAMAQEKCLIGFVSGLVIGNVNVTDNCVIDGAIITGNVTATLDVLESLVVNKSVVQGRIKVSGGAALINDTLVTAGNNIVIDEVDNDTVVRGNLVQGSTESPGNIVVRNTLEAAVVLIDNNTVANGNIRCVAPGDQTANVYATNNLVPNGTTTCFGQ